MHACGARSPSMPGSRARATNARGMPTPPERYPAAELHSAAEPPAKPSIDAIHAELTAPSPNAAAIAQHVDRLRGFPALAALIEGWYLHPNTQLFITELTELGL